MIKYFFAILAALVMLSCATQTPATEPSPNPRSYNMPAYSTSFVVSPEVYQKAVNYYTANYYKLSNRERFVVIDFSLHSSKARLLYLDIANQSFTTYHVAHGQGSDPDGDGYATKFSNVANSKMSSLGAYRTLGTYNGKHGYSLYLRGLDSTNDNAEDRAIVMHPADYVSETDKHAGRSWGCPAIDPSISRGLIDKIKNGVIIFAAVK